MAPQSILPTLLSLLLLNQILPSCEKVQQFDKESFKWTSSKRVTYNIHTRSLMDIKIKSIKKELIQLGYTKQQIQSVIDQVREGGDVRRFEVRGRLKDLYRQLTHLPEAVDIGFDKSKSPGSKFVIGFDEADKRIFDTKLIEAEKEFDRIQMEELEAARIANMSTNGTNSAPPRNPLSYFSVYQYYSFYFITLNIFY